jgi:hypothetical protein
MTDPRGIPRDTTRDTDPEAITPVEVPRLHCICGASTVNATAGYSTTNKWISAAIRFITRGKVSHAWVAFDDATLGIRMVLQAEWFGYYPIPWERWKTQNKLIAQYRPKVDPERQAKAIRVMAEKIGLKYDWEGGFWVAIAAWFKKWMKSKFTFRPSRSPGKLMCAESQVYFFVELGIDFSKDLDEEVTSPVELMELSKTSSQLELV